ncbi:24741_t:CDS:2, partial [Gigaspora margarita]
MNNKQFQQFMELMTKAVSKDEPKLSKHEEIQQKVESELRDLKKHIEGLALKYANLSAQLKDTKVNHPRDNFYRGGRPQNNYKWKRKEDIECWKCGEIEHIVKKLVPQEKKIEEPNTNDPIMIQNPLPLKNPKRKCGPSKIDSLKPYNVADDILSLPTS